VENVNVEPRKIGRITAGARVGPGVLAVAHTVSDHVHLAITLAVRGLPAVSSLPSYDPEIELDQ
jgi:hypothetical protein